MSRSPWCCSCSHDDRWRSPGPRRHCVSPQSTASRHSRSPAPHRQSRTSPSLSRRPSPAGMTRTPTREGLCHLDAVHLLPRRGNYPGAVVRPLPLGGCPLIAVLAAHAPGLPPGTIYHILMWRINAYSDSATCPQFLSRRMTQKLIKIRQQMIAKCQQRQSGNFSPT